MTARFDDRDASLLSVPKIETRSKCGSSRVDGF